MNDFFKDKVYAISGATSGIGEQIAIELAKNGAKILSLGRNKEKLENLLSKLEGNEHTYKIFDSNNLSTCEEAIKSGVEELGKLSGLVHSAGGAPFSLLRDLNLDIIQKVLNINLSCFFAFCKEALKIGNYKKNQMSIIGISSAASLSSPAAMSLYSASKAGLNASIKSFAKEYAKKGVRFNAIAPSYVKTPMVDGFKSNLLGEDEYQKRLRETMPLGEILTSDVTDLALFLLSDKANKITGEIIKISGGRES